MKTSKNGLKKILVKHSGRDSKGHVSIRSRGGRQKRFYRTIDWKRDKHDSAATVKAIEYDPNRSCNVALLEYSDGEMRYILHPLEVKVGDTLYAGDKALIEAGHAMPVGSIPIGVPIHNVELRAGVGAVMVRTAGGQATIVGKDEKHAIIKFPSGELRKIPLTCYATIGQIGNEGRKHEKLGKAGKSRHLGIRPHVRGVAMNPRSHPHGGGEGRSGEGMHPKTPWGKSARGTKTRSRKKMNPLIVKGRN